jgi:hypothetical protein
VAIAMPSPIQGRSTTARKPSATSRRIDRRSGAAARSGDQNAGQRRSRHERDLASEGGERVARLELLVRQEGREHRAIGGLEERLTGAHDERQGREEEHGRVVRRQRERGHGEHPNRIRREHHVRALGTVADEPSGDHEQHQRQGPPGEHESKTRRAVPGANDEGRYRDHRKLVAERARGLAQPQPAEVPVAQSRP